MPPRASNSTKNGLKSIKKIVESISEPKAVPPQELTQTENKRQRGYEGSRTKRGRDGSPRRIVAVLHRNSDLTNTCNNADSDCRHHHCVLNRRGTVLVSQKSPQVFRDELRHFCTLMAARRTVFELSSGLSTLISSVAEHALKDFFRFLIMKNAFQRYNPTER